MNSVGTKTDDVTYGSFISAILSGVGIFDGFSRSSTSPAVVRIRYRGLGGRPRGFRDRLAHLRVSHSLDPRDDIADLARGQLLDRPHVGREDADLLDVVRAAVRHQ